jgi:hypothetical protein
MLAITFIFSCLSVCGFYLYVLVQFHREERRLNAQKKRLQKDLYEMEREPDREQGEAERHEDPGALGSGTADIAEGQGKRKGLIWVSLSHLMNSR